MLAKPRARALPSPAPAIDSSSSRVCFLHSCAVALRAKVSVHHGYLQAQTLARYLPGTSEVSMPGAAPAPESARSRVWTVVVEILDRKVAHAPAASSDTQTSTPKLCHCDDGVFISCPSAFSLTPRNQDAAPSLVVLHSAMYLAFVHHASASPSSQHCTTVPLRSCSRLGMQQEFSIRLRVHKGDPRVEWNPAPQFVRSQ